MTRLILGVLCAAVFVPAGSAAETQTWTQSQREEFEKGKRHNLSLRSDGRLTLAPSFQELFDSSSAYLWALARDSKGNVYVGGGGPGGDTARLTVIGTDSKSRTLAQIEGLEIHALALDRKDRVYAASSPDGKIFRVDRSGKVETFYEPNAKYIWGMAFGPNGDLFVATGDQGEIHRVSPDGKGSVLFKTEETHARSVAVDAKGNVIVGTEPGGLILLIDASGKGFVLHQGGKREITAVAVASDGAVYAAGVGDRRGAGGSLLPPPQGMPAPGPQQAGAAGQQQGAPGPQAPGAQQRGIIPPAPRAVLGGSELYRIDPDGFPQTVWTHSQDIVYAIAFDAENRPVLGTGNSGAIYRVDSDVMHTVIATAPPTQVTALLGAPDGRMYAATGNVGKVYQVGPGLAKEGWLESEIYDASLFSQWGRLSYSGELNGGAVEVATRSGNLDRAQDNWSGWSGAIAKPEGDRVSSPAARFMQWRATVKAGPGSASPSLSSVQVSYLPRNVAPRVTQVEITPPNYQFPQQALRVNPSDNITLPPLSQRSAAKRAKPAAAGTTSQSMKRVKGYTGARWAASDPNDDSLLYKVEIRGVDESEWKLLSAKVEEAHISWDSTSYPDGRYVVRVTATDAPANPPDKALTHQAESEPFLIDNTPPVISELRANAVNGNLVVQWNAKDALSRISRAEYSLDGGEWTFVEPSTLVSDSAEHDYVLTLSGVPHGERTVAVRVADEFDNEAIAKTVARYR